MADLAQRLPTNVEGEVYVDASCIDCDTCRWIAPETFDRAGEKSRVHTQPRTPEALQRALMAVVACPTASIGTVSRLDLKPAIAAFPAPIEDGSPVLHCGFHSEASFGAASYLVLRERGNVLVDSPRFAAPLVRRIEELGGVRWMFLTHKDDVADHAKLAERFGCERVLHEGDLEPGTAGVERIVTGRERVALDDDLLVIPTPGHTAGSACLLFSAPRGARGKTDGGESPGAGAAADPAGSGERFLFSGDHLAYSERLGHIYGFRSACWHDWGELVASTRVLLDLRFEWLLPGHGHRLRLPAAEMAASMRRCVAWMESAR